MSRRPLLILLNGELKSPAAVRRAAREAGVIVCADGGARHAARLGLKPRVILGDMDSLPRRLPDWPGAAYLCDFDPDCSDFEKALRFAVERGVEEAWVAGATGGGLDHTLVNLALAERYAAKLRVRLIDEPRAWLLEPGLHRLPCRRGRRLTLLSVVERSTVTASGVRYPLRGSRLERGSRGLANRATAARVLVRVHAGLVWAIF